MEYNSDGRIDSDATASSKYSKEEIEQALQRVLAVGEILRSVLTDAEKVALAKHLAQKHAPENNK